jgi:hypothetical protein
LRSQGCCVASAPDSAHESPTRKGENKMAERGDRKNETTEDRPELDEARREALAKMGRFAGYTAPVMLALLGATKARASTNGSVDHKVPF